MVPRNGFEPSTVRVWTVCSSQLSYLGINGGDKRDRTADLRSASASLSQTELYPHIKLFNTNMWCGERDLNSHVWDTRS